MTDLTTLEGADTPGKVRALCAKAVHPEPGDPTCPSVAAVCVYPDLVAVAKRALAGSGVAVASVATAFPSGRAPMEVKLADVRAAVADGEAEVETPSKLVDEVIAPLVAEAGKTFLAALDEITVDELCKRAQAAAPRGAGADVDFTI